jgi:uncharacterized protein (DUF2249 family)
MTTTDQQLDVRAEPPARRHELIFDTYEQLEPGAGFVLVNDHDPKPLYYQFAAEHVAGLPPPQTNIVPGAVRVLFRERH